MAINHYLGRQPILGKDNSIVAYHLYYGDKSLAGRTGDNRYTTATVISNVLNKFGTKDLLGGYPAFVKVDYTFLLHDIIFSIPKEFFIFSLLEGIDVDERLIERVEQLRGRGFRLAVNDMELSGKTLEKFKPVLPHMHYCLIDTKRTRSGALEEMLDTLKAYPVKLIATKVETHAQYEALCSMGFDMFQGYFFAEPVYLENKKYDPNQLSVIRLCNMMMSEASIAEIAAAFEENHAITMQLLQFINSAAFHFRKRISSIHHILTLMGRNPITQWLLLMIYSKSVSRDDKEQSPLLLMVKSRTELMTGLLKLIRPNAKSGEVGEAYFVGVLSLMDALFGVELEKVLEDLNIAEEVSDALLKKEGLLGEIYELIPSIERFDTEAIEAFITKYNLNQSDVVRMMVNAIESVNAFEASLKSDVSVA